MTELDRRRPALRSQFELREIEPRRDGASDQCPVAGAFGRLPCYHGTIACGRSPAGEIGPSPTAATCHRHRRSRASAARPRNNARPHRVDAVPMRALAARQQEIDRGGAERPSVSRPGRGTSGDNVRLPDAASGSSSAMMSAAGRPAAHQNLFLRSRIRRTLPRARRPPCTLCLTDGSSARRNTWSSSPAPSCRERRLARGAKFLHFLGARFQPGLSGSMVSANLPLAAVYSWPQ